MAATSPKRAKRTYNLSERAIHRVRDLAQRETLPPTQDAVVEVAIDRLYEAVTYAEEEARWDGAMADPEFVQEVGDLARLYDAGETWPT